MTYAELQTELRNYRDTYKVKLNCKLNAKKETLQAELKRVMAIPAQTLTEVDLAAPAPIEPIENAAVQEFRAYTDDMELAMDNIQAVRETFLPATEVDTDFWALLSHTFWLVSVELPKAAVKDLRTAARNKFNQLKASFLESTKRQRATLSKIAETVDSDLDKIQAASDILFPQAKIDATFELVGRIVGWLWVRKFDALDICLGLTVHQATYEYFQAK